MSDKINIVKKCLIKFGCGVNKGKKKYIIVSSKEHLNKAHNIEIADIYDFSESIQSYIKNKKLNQKQKQNKQSKLNRKEIMEYVKSIIQPHADTLKNILNSTI